MLMTTIRDLAFHALFSPLEKEKRQYSKPQRMRTNVALSKEWNPPVTNSITPFLFTQPPDKTTTINNYTQIPLTCKKIIDKFLSLPLISPHMPVVITLPTHNSTFCN